MSRKGLLVGIAVAVIVVAAAALAVASTGAGSAGESASGAVAPSGGSSDITVSSQPGGTKGCPLAPDPEDPSDVTKQCIIVDLPEGVSPDSPEVQRAVQQKVCQEEGPTVASQAPFNYDCHQSPAPSDD
jgi:hypothetical protein